MLRALWAVVPVKPFADAKQRLMPLLSGSEREALACAMLQDVLFALTKAASVSGITVVTGDAKAAKLARDAGAEVLADDENTGTSTAVAKAARHLARHGRVGMLVIPADVPAVTPQDIDSLVAAHRAGPSVTLARAVNDGGTNALACSPPEAIACCFGEDSLRCHRLRAEDRGIEPQVFELASMAHDIDRPADLAYFMAHSSRTRTREYLVTNRMAERLGLETAGV